MVPKQVKPRYPNGQPSNLNAVLYLNSRKGKADLWDTAPINHSSMKPNGF